MDTDDKTQVPATEVQEVTSTPEVVEEVTEPQVENEVESSMDETFEVGVEHRPTRAEKRIAQLSGKLKEAREQADQLKNTRATIFDEGDELVRPEEYEQGIDPKALEARITGRVQKEVQKALEYQSNVERHKAVLSEYAQDLEDVLVKYPVFNPESESYDEELEAVLLEEYDDLNTDQRGNFTPRKKAIAIAERLLKVKDRGAVVGASKVTQKLVDQVGEQALTPNATSQDEGDFEAEKLYQKAIESGDDADWAEVLKRRVSPR